MNYFYTGNFGLKQTGPNQIVWQNIYTKKKTKKKKKKKT